MGSIEQSCFWLANRSSAAPVCPLAGEVACQVAVIGGGFTGLWTALFLKQLQPALDVAVLEQGVVGWGASGRNAGIVSACVDHSHALAITHFGRAEAEKLARLGIQNIDEIEAFAGGCDFERTGQLHVALTEAQVEDGRRNAGIGRELGFEGYRMLSAEEVRKEIDSPLYLGGVFVPGGGIVDPIKLVDKVRCEAELLGVRFFERTRVTKLEAGRVVTAGGALTADKVILATDAYTHHLFPRLLFRYIPLYDYILVSEPLSDAQRSLIGWRNRQGVTDGRTFFNYYRLTADQRILWGTSEAMYYPPNRVDESCDHSPRHYQALRDSFRRHFPQLGALQFPFEWGGPIASTTRLTPFFGTASGGRVIYALGYTGHGIGSTRIAGKILAHMVLSRPSELLRLAMVKRQPFPYPPEPLRAAAVAAVTHSLKRVDEGHNPSTLLRILDVLGIGFSS